MRIEQNISLKPYNTFGIDVRAISFLEVTDEKELQEFITEGGLKHMEFLVLGGGSNILFTEDYLGLVIRNCIEGIAVEEKGVDEVLVTAGAGMVWDDLVQFCVNEGYGGIENLVMIPGSVGASPIQNIGAYGVELKDVFHSLRAIEISSGKIRLFEKRECKFGYRDSIFKGEAKGKFIVISVSLLLKKNHIPDISYGAIRGELETMGLGREAGIREVAMAISNIRSSKLPDPEQIGNAGSFFKNPVIAIEKFDQIRNRYPETPSYKERKGFVKVPAGWLIEQCGWKGKSHGNAAVHDKQALVLVNMGGAEGKEVRRLARLVKASVFDEFGIDLEYEVIII
jgi:UDP-N-acetylmuramate dehydrogenase